MATKAILILENIWWDLDSEKNGNQASVLPFFEGLSRLNEDVKIYYMTFTNANGFKESLDHLLTARQDRLFIYVASHGDGTHLGNSNFSNISNIINVAVQVEKSKRVEGIIFGACEIGGAKSSSSLEMLHWKTGITWVLAYQNIMDWMSSTLIDLNFMSSMIQIDLESLSKRAEIIECAASALKLFNPIEKIGWSRTANKNNNVADIDIKDAVRFLVQPNGSGNVFQDNTNLLIKKAYSSM